MAEENCNTNTNAKESSTTTSNNRSSGDAPLPQKGKSPIEDPSPLSQKCKSPMEDLSPQSEQAQQQPPATSATSNDKSQSEQPQQQPPAPSNSKYKGVVLQKNRHWGAQIYANHNRVWLGTFRSEEEAAMAYDSAAIKLRNGDSHRNMNCFSLAKDEAKFQELYSVEAVLNMIRDGTYQAKLFAFVKGVGSSGNAETQTETGVSNDQHMGDGGVVYQLMFQKELTPSDVGKLNRLVIPKKHAVKFFPAVSESGEIEDENSGVDVQLTFMDRGHKTWTFRYCYWKSSQSFVFTRGWNRFVKEKCLKEKDVVVFYRCGSGERQEGGVTEFWMIDVQQNKGEGGSSNVEGSNLGGVVVSGSEGGEMSDKKEGSEGGEISEKKDGVGEMSPVEVETEITENMSVNEGGSGSSTGKMNENNGGVDLNGTKISEKKGRRNRSEKMGRGRGYKRNGGEIIHNQSVIIGKEIIQLKGGSTGEEIRREPGGEEMGERKGKRVKLFGVCIS
ncbi:hypothetical protein AMTRI_Chr06g194040 [Amborella trichopoda]